MKIAFIIKGISGSGKSTRVAYFINSLRENGITDELFYYNNKQIGILFQDLNLLIIGKEQKTGLPFQGFDSVTGVFGKVEMFSNFLRDNNFNVIVEGAGITDSHRFRSKFLREYCGFERTLIQYYNFNFEQKNDYFKRILDRSGKLPRTEVMFNKIANFEGDYKKALQEKTENDLVCYDTFDCEVSDFTNKVLTLL